MSTPDVGDYRIATLEVTDVDGNPGDGTTTATLTVVDPDDATTTPAVTSGAGGHNWASAAYEFTQPGEWIERWTVTGRGAGKQRTTILVAPDPGDVPSGGRVYATTADYARWLDTAPPAGSRRALAAASRVIDDMLRTAVYDVDDGGLPTDTDVIAALRDATCAQAEFGRAAGDSNFVGAAGVTQVALGSLSYTKAAAGTGSAAAGGNGRWSATAWGILSGAGLTGNGPWEQ